MSEFEKEVRVISEQLNAFWWAEIQQTSTNLSFEILSKILLEVLFIRDVEKRELTADEQVTYVNLLQMFRDNSNIMHLPLAPTKWYMNYLNHMHLKIKSVRDNLIAHRTQIMGPVDGGKLYE